METLIVVILGVLGLVLGSFAGAQVWRLRARQLVADKAEGEEYDKHEYKQLLPLTSSKIRDDRSRCLHCGHELHFIDLIPLVSWLSTRGRCRYCNQSIGNFEPLMEVGVACVMIAVYLPWPVELVSMGSWAVFVSWEVAIVLLAILFAYDLKWFLLPNIPVFLLGGVGVVVSCITIAMSPDKFGTLLSIVGGIAILSGIYAFVWVISRGGWIGFGDVKLGLGLALLLADWRYGFIALFAANLIGCLVVIPGLMSGKIKRTTRVPFGPLLIAGALVALLFGSSIVNWYSSLIL